VLISLFGWFVALRGLAMMAIPSAIETGADEAISSPGLQLGAPHRLRVVDADGRVADLVGWIKRRDPV